MEIFNSVQELQKWRKEQNLSVGFVPTMGALHHGHKSLIERARKENEALVVSVFVNPTQFLESEDLSSYPRKAEADRRICELSGVDALFLPSIDAVYGDNEVIVKAPNGLGYILEGAQRPGHFDGVLQVVLKLFGITQPTRAYFGQKDAQQLMLIEQMAKTFSLSVEIISVPTVRESDGLALSSRNIYLDTQERKNALLISKSLKRATRHIVAGELKSSVLILEMHGLLKPLDVEYIAIVNREFEQINKVEIGNTIILVAAKVGETRLIDNVWI